MPSSVQKLAFFFQNGLQLRQRVKFWAEGKLVTGAVVDLYGGQTQSGSGSSYQILLAHGDVGKVQSWRVTFKAEEAKANIEQIQRNKDHLVLVPDDGEWWEEAKLRCREETDSFLKMGKRTWSSEVIQSRTQSLKVVGTSFYTHSITFTLL